MTTESIMQAQLQILQYWD